MQAYYLEITKAGFYIYIVLLLTAAICDIWKYLIPNLLSISLVVLFFVMALSSPFGVNWLSHLGAALVFFLIGFGLYAYKIMGAGDVKLITAVSLFAGFEHLMTLLLFVALAGGALALVLILVRLILSVLMSRLKKSPENLKLPRILVPGEAVPYGVGVAAGAIMISGTLPILGYF